MQANELLRQGGDWLATARKYIQNNAINGDRVSWGSDDKVTLSVCQIEELAAFVAAKILETNNSADYSRGVTAGKLEALKYTPAERERYGRWVTEGEMYRELQAKRLTRD